MAALVPINIRNAAARYYAAAQAARLIPYLASPARLQPGSRANGITWSMAFQVTEGGELVHIGREYGLILDECFTRADMFYRLQTASAALESAVKAEAERRKTQ